MIRSTLAPLILATTLCVSCVSLPAETRSETLKRRYFADVRGDVDDQSISILETTLSRMPHADPCLVLMIDEPNFSLYAKRTLNGQSAAGIYFPASHPEGEKIALPKPLLEETITHEFAHKRTAVLGCAFLKKWEEANENQYGIGLSTTEIGTHSWDDGEYGIRFGFCRPYGRVNASEDIATLTQYIRHDLRSAFRADKDSARILIKKVELLEEGEFIHHSEAYSFLCALRGQSRR